VDIGIGAESIGIPDHDPLAQRVDIRGQAAVPVLPAFGGKLNRTIATLRSRRSARWMATRRAVRDASISARSLQTCISPATSERENVHERSHPVHGIPAPSERPP
jgi:hypothetical protein